jgi:adenylate cyclase
MMNVVDQPLRNLANPVRTYGRQLRIGSGLVLFAFATSHFINHAFGLVSIDLMQSGQQVREVVTRSLPGTALLVTAAAVHFALGISRFLNARTWRLGTHNIIQLVFGLLIPIFLARHVLGTRGVHAMFGVEDNYAYALWAMWPREALNQAVLMMLVWVHGCIGIHHWLMLKPWYRRSMWLWYGLAVIIPALSYAGFETAGQAAKLQSTFESPLTAEQYTVIQQTMTYSALTYYAILGGAIGIWSLLALADHYGQKIVVSYANGPTVLVQRGISLLDVSRINRIPHASVCGGRARCSTCRVRVIKGLELQPPASASELKVLKRVSAPFNVRLACQLQPNSDVTISTLLPANVDVQEGTQVDRFFWGVEQDVTILFCDLRGFTRMSEGRLSFDVVFLLNQFLGRMAEAIEDTGGYVDKFMGDGIMAIFGMDAPVRDGAVRALAAARAMHGVLDSLNQSLRDELPVPLSVGIGIHTGAAILGRIGAAHRTEAAGRITALGETVNIASRLEGMTKELDVQVVVSMRTIEASGLDPDGKLVVHEVEVRGLSQTIAVYTSKQAAELPSSP